MTITSILLGIAIFSSIIFILQIISTFLGMDSADGISADFDSNLEDDGPFQLFTFRNLILFLMGISWGGLIAIKELNIQSYIGIILFGVLMSVILIAIQALLFYSMHKLEDKKIPSLNDAIGAVGIVYIPISNSTIGKVSVTVNGSMQTLKATTKSEHSMPTGSRIKVSGIEGDLLVVESFNV